jgi:hypothetical protein
MRQVAPINWRGLLLPLTWPTGVPTLDEP